MPTFLKPSIPAHARRLVETSYPTVGPAAAVRENHADLRDHCLWIANEVLKAIASLSSATADRPGRPVTAQDILDPRQARDHLYPRQIALAVSHDMLGDYHTDSEIAAAFGLDEADALRALAAHEKLCDGAFGPSLQKKTSTIVNLVRKNPAAHALRSTGTLPRAAVQSLAAG